MIAPAPYQFEGCDFLAARQFAYLGDEMRVRKTRQAIMALQKIGARRVFVACPAIAVEHWRHEFARWWDTAISPLPERLVVSYDRFLLNANEILSQRWDVAIADEAHFAKNPEAKRTKLVFGKGGIGYCSGRLWCLSGTPAPKHAGELWCMLRAFGVVGMTYDEFTRRYCTWNELEGRITGTREEMIPELRALLAKVMLRRTRKQVAPDMPDIGFEFLEIESRFNKDIKIPANISDDQLLGWMESNATGDRENRIDVAMAKVGPLSDEITFSVGNALLKQTVVFGWHLEPLEKMASVLRAQDFQVEKITGATSSSDRAKIQAMFREGYTQIIVAQLLAAGTAIDLSAARHGYFLEMDWVPGNNVQAANRLINLDLKDKVTIDVATMPRTADDRIQQVLLRRVRELAKLY